MGTLIVGAILILMRTDHKRNRQRQKKAASHHVAETAATEQRVPLRIRHITET